MSGASYYFNILPDDLMKELFLYADLPSLISYDFIHGVNNKSSYWQYRLDELTEIKKHKEPSSHVADIKTDKFSGVLHAITYLRNIHKVLYFIRTKLSNITITEYKETYMSKLYDKLNDELLLLKERILQAITILDEIDRDSAEPLTIKYYRPNEMPVSFESELDYNPVVKAYNIPDAYLKIRNHILQFSIDKDDILNHKSIDVAFSKALMGSDIYKSTHALEVYVAIAERIFTVYFSIIEMKLIE